MIYILGSPNFRGCVGIIVVFTSWSTTPPRATASWPKTCWHRPRPHRQTAPPPEDRRRPAIPCRAEHAQHPLPSKIPPGPVGREGFWGTGRRRECALTSSGSRPRRHRRPPWRRTRRGQRPGPGCRPSPWARCRRAVR